MQITSLVEPARLCGYRKKGGLYLIGGKGFAECCKLSFPLTVCPCCGHGVRPSRGFSWIVSDLFGGSPCTKEDAGTGPQCVLNRRGERMGLMWVGEKYYPTVQGFRREAAAMGISKRISQLPNDIEPGKTWIALAHRKALSHFNPDNSISFVPGVFMIFLLQQVQYVVKGDETNEFLQRLEKRGIKPVSIMPAGQPITMEL